MPDIAHICSSKRLLLKLAWIGPLLLSEKSLRHLPSAVPGVYLLQHFSPVRMRFPAFYVGQSRNLRRRLAEHRLCAAGGVGFFRQLRPTYFSAAAASAACLDDIERSLILLLSPPANDRALLPTTLVLPAIPPLRLFQPQTSNSNIR